MLGNHQHHSPQRLQAQHERKFRARSKNERCLTGNVELACFAELHSEATCEQRRNHAQWPAAVAAQLSYLGPSP